MCINPNFFGKNFVLTKYLFFIIFSFISFFSSAVFSYDLLDDSGNVIRSKITVQTKNNILYISKDELIESLNLVFIDDKSFFLNDNLVITLLKDNSYFSINRKIFNLSYNTITDEKGSIFFPVKSFSQIVNQFIGNEFFIFSDKTLVVKSDKLFKINVSTDGKKEKIQNLNISGNIKNIEIKEKSNGILIKIHTNKRFKTGDLSSYITADNHLNLTLYKSRIDTNYFQKKYKFSSNVINKIIPFQLEQSSQLTFILKRSKQVISKSISIKKNLISINLFLKKTGEMNNDEIKDRLISSKNRWKIDRIIVDAGHGGKDPGAIGYGGIYEKDVTLAIAKYLRQFLLKDKDLRVYMTRDSDEFIPLKERTKIANENKGKLFVSIHCNAVKQKKVSGFETYFLSPARTERAMKVAAKENASIKYESNSDNYKRLTDDNFIVLSMVQDNFAKESEKWASLVQDEIDQISRTSNRGVDQAGFYVLIGASMPSILVEAGFISNPKEEKLLKSKPYQKKIAKAIYNSIIKLKSEIGN